MNIEILLLLVLAHLVGDFVLQSDTAVQEKRALRLKPHVMHAAVHMVLAYVLVGLWWLWLLPLAVGAVHGVIDVIKQAIARRLAGSTGRPGRGWRIGLFWGDQLLHLAAILVLVSIIAEPHHEPQWYLWLGDDAAALTIALIGLVLTVWCGALVVAFGIEPYLGHLEQDAMDSGGDDAPDRASDRHGDRDAGKGETDPDVGDASVDRGFPRAGRLIGQLERALVFLFVLTGNMTGVGFLVAAKSVFRFGEIREPTQRKEAEYILIGTLMSFTWAIFSAWITRVMLFGE